MKNKILIGIGTFVAILAVIGILAFSFTMTPVAATNVTNATETINITCTTAILLNDSTISGGTGSVLQSCIDLYSNRSAATVDTLNATSQCWSGLPTYDFIRLLNKGNNWLVITLNLTSDGGFIGQPGGQQFGNIVNAVYARLRSGSQTNSTITGTNDNDTACYNNTAYNATSLQVGTPVVLCGALGWDIYKNEIYLFKEWFIQPKTAPGAYNFTETITATQEQCGGADPTKVAPMGMYLGTGTVGQVIEFSPIGVAFGPTMQNSSIQKITSAAWIKTPNANLGSSGAKALLSDVNFGQTTDLNLYEVNATNFIGPVAVSGLTGDANANYTQIALSYNSSRAFFLGTSSGGTTLVRGHAKECVISAANAVNCAAGDDIPFVTLAGLTTWTLWAGFVDEGSFDPIAAALDTDNNAINFVLLGAVASGQPYQVAVARWDTTANSLTIVSAPVNTPFLAGASYNFVGLGFDPDAQMLYAFNTAGTPAVFAMPIARDGDSILSVAGAFSTPNAAFTGALGGVTVQPTGQGPGMVFNN